MSYETLIYFPAVETEEGTAPGVYFVASSPEEERPALGHGGMISDNWPQYLRELQSVSDHCL